MPNASQNPNGTVGSKKKVGPPPRPVTIEAIPLRHPDGTLVTTSFGPEWVKFLCSAVQRLLTDGTFIVVDGVIRVAKRKTDTQQYLPDS
jgi:hypothetical protein